MKMGAIDDEIRASRRAELKREAARRAAWIRKHRTDPAVRAWLEKHPPPAEWTGTPLEWAYEERPGS